MAWAGLREGEALGVSEGRLPFSRSSPPGHAVVLRFGWCGIAGGVMDSAVLVVERCADSEVGGREGGPLAGRLPWLVYLCRTLYLFWKYSVEQVGLFPGR